MNSKFWRTFAILTLLAVILIAVYWIWAWDKKQCCKAVYLAPYSVSSQPSGLPGTLRANPLVPKTYLHPTVQPPRVPMFEGYTPSIEQYAPIFRIDDIEPPPLTIDLPTQSRAILINPHNGFTFIPIYPAPSVDVDEPRALWYLMPALGYLFYKGRK